ncbi:hypothetical protein BpHYR1_038487 [Brachionus plicatilis]|uniref:Uncharacterized protein n=1 Tax=Brachionus plicatilis TaxID=10195 RepID=A0A3M7PYC7_BRAPC|nr:hypothetical protein BpHYR1_038487 [Brachionus plicatilis]
MLNIHLIFLQLELSKCNVGGNGTLIRITLGGVCEVILWKYIFNESKIIVACNFSHDEIMILKYFEHI